YNVSVSTATAWFPDKRGLANGVCVGTTGLSPIIFAPLGNFLITTMGVNMSFHICGIIFAVGVIVASRFLAAPPKDWTPENWIRGDRSS
ncbi:MAG: MFS transporter, partial [Slackia sp.]